MHKQSKNRLANNILIDKLIIQQLSDSQLHYNKKARLDWQQSNYNKQRERLSWLWPIIHFKLHWDWRLRPCGRKESLFVVVSCFSWQIICWLYDFCCRISYYEIHLAFLIDLWVYSLAGYKNWSYDVKYQIENFVKRFFVSDWG